MRRLASVILGGCALLLAAGAQAAPPAASAPLSPLDHGLRPSVMAAGQAAPRMVAGRAHGLPQDPRRGRGGDPRRQGRGRRRLRPLARPGRPTGSTPTPCSRWARSARWRPPRPPLRSAAAGRLDPRSRRRRLPQALEAAVLPGGPRAGGQPAHADVAHLRAWGCTASPTTSRPSPADPGPGAGRPEAGQERGRAVQEHAGPGHRLFGRRRHGGAGRDRGRHGPAAGDPGADAGVRPPGHEPQHFRGARYRPATSPRPMAATARPGPPRAAGKASPRPAPRACGPAPTTWAAWSAG